MIYLKATGRASRSALFYSKCVNRKIPMLTYFTYCLPVARMNTSFQNSEVRCFDGFGFHHYLPSITAFTFTRARFEGFVYLGITYYFCTQANSKVIYSAERDDEYFENGKNARTS